MALLSFAVFSVPGTSSSKIHGWLGVTVMSLGLQQPLNAFLRPHKPNPGESPSGLRVAWSWLHKSCGWAAVILATPTIFLGGSINSSFTLIFRILHLLCILAVLGLTTYLCVLRKRRTSKLLEGQGATTVGRSVEIGDV